MVNRLLISILMGSCAFYAKPEAKVWQGEWHGIRMDHVPMAKSNRLFAWHKGKLLLFQADNTGKTRPDILLYDPKVHRWSTMDTSLAPVLSDGFSKVYLNGKVIVWGGCRAWSQFSTCMDLDDKGWIYDVDSNQWSLLTANGAPSARVGGQFLTNGNQIVLWGGKRWNQDQSPEILNDGYILDLAKGHWEKLPTDGAPSPRDDAALALSADKLVVWGGDVPSAEEGMRNNHFLNDGAVFDFRRGTWAKISQIEAPTPRANEAVAIAGHRLFLWGGSANYADTLPDDFNTFGDGYMLDLDTGTWTSLPPPPHIEPRAQSAAIWTGSRFVIWGGVAMYSTPNGYGWNYFRGGAAFDPVQGTWEELPLLNAPDECVPQAVFWQGKLAILGDYGFMQPLFLGGIFDVHTAGERGNQ